jgi:hypothetical protein
MKENGKKQNENSEGKESEEISLRHIRKKGC